MSSDLLHPLIDALHDAARVRGWHPEQLLDLTRVMAERGRVPAKATVASLTTAFRARNRATVAQTHEMAASALEQAQRRAGALQRALGSAPRRRSVAPKGARSEDLMRIKVTIRDREALDRLDVEAIARYMTANGWKRMGDVRRKFDRADVAPVASEWRKDAYVIVLPAHFVADRVARVSDLLEVLEADERRSQLLIYRDLLNA